MLIDYLYQIESWNSNEAFLRDAIVTSSAKLLAKCHDEAEKNNLVKEKEVFVADDLII